MQILMLLCSCRRNGLKCAAIAMKVRTAVMVIEYIWTDQFLLMFDKHLVYRDEAILNTCRIVWIIELEQILVLILDRVLSIVD